MQAWRCDRIELPLDRVLVMGVLNMTPDSFSDGGLYADAASALARAREMVGQGADLVDIGGESSRPGSAEVPPAQELERVLGTVTALAAEGVPVSIDTRHAGVARACLDAGAVVLNDIGGFRDPGMVEVAAATGAGVVVMHMLGEPGTMQEAPSYGDVVSEVSAFLAERAAALEAAGVSRDRIVVDPGFGFGKTLEHNLALLRGIPRIAETGYPVLVGVSRKRMIGEMTGVTEPRQRVAGSVAAAIEAVRRGASVVRAHDVAETVQALAVLAAVGDGPR